MKCTKDVRKGQEQDALKAGEIRLRAPQHNRVQVHQPTTAYLQWLGRRAPQSRAELPAWPSAAHQSPPRSTLGLVGKSKQGADNLGSEREDRLRRDGERDEGEQER